MSHDAPRRPGDALLPDGYSSLVRHDLIAPLRQIAPLSDIVLDHVEPDRRDSASQVMGAVSGIAEKVAAKLARLTVHIELDRHHPVPTETDLVDLLHAEARTVSEQIGLDINVTTFPARLDPVLAALALREVIDNAWRYGEADASARLAVRLGARGRTVELVLENRGPGVEPAYRAVMFDLFRRLHSDGSTARTGAGLAIARKALALGGATIECVEPSGEGCAIRIVWPGAA